MADPIVWPERLLVPASVKLSLVTASRGGGMSTAGVEQVVASPSSRWALTFSSLAVHTPAQVLALRAIEAQLDGRAGVLVLPIYDKVRAVGHAGDPELRQDFETAFDDGSLFDDGKGFLQPDAEEVTVTADALLNATQLTLSWGSGAAPAPGQHFSVGHRLYRVATVAVGDTGFGTVSIRPWLREAVPAGTLLNFSDPVGLFRLVKDDGLSPDLDLWRFSSASVDFVEA